MAPGSGKLHPSTFVQDDHRISFCFMYYCCLETVFSVFIGCSGRCACAAYLLLVVVDILAEAVETFFENFGASKQPFLLLRGGGVG